MPGSEFGPIFRKSNVRISMKPPAKKKDTRWTMIHYDKGMTYHSEVRVLFHFPHISILIHQPDFFCVICSGRCGEFQQCDLWTGQTLHPDQGGRCRRDNDLRQSPGTLVCFWTWRNYLVLNSLLAASSLFTSWYLPTSMKSYWPGAIPGLESSGFLGISGEKLPLMAPFCIWI